MNSPLKSDPIDSIQDKRGWQFFLRAAASVKLGVVLLAVTSVVLIVATLLDAWRGLEYADWHVYKSGWFIALLAVLSLNILAAILVRFPWKNRWGFLLAHLGILVLLCGAMETYLSGIDEQLSLAEGEKADHLYRAHWAKFTIAREAKAGEKKPPKDVFPFRPGPFDWPEGKTYDGWHESHGVKPRVLKYYAHASSTETWIPDKAKEGEPAIHFILFNAGNKRMFDSWLAGEALGGPGVPKLEMMKAPLDSMREDFLNPPKLDEDPDGVLSIHYDGRTERIPVSKNLGKKIALEGSKMEVEIVAYYANAKLRGTAQFESDGEEPKNPILELKVYLPDHEEPIRELAFAKSPLMSLAAMHGKELPVRFWYHQPAFPAPAGLDFLKTPDGKLYCRAGRDGKYVSEGEVKAGNSIKFAETLRFEVLEYLPYANHKVDFHPVEQESEGRVFPAAALVEIESGDFKQQVWLLRNDPKYGFQAVSLPKENIAIEFGDETMPLGFSVRLLKATRELNPGGKGDAGYSSTVQVIDEARDIDEERKIVMNEPLTHGDFTFYQSGYNELSGGVKVSTLKVTYDPGRFLKYLGCWMICIGIALRYITGSQIYKKWRQETFLAAAKAVPVIAIILLGVSWARAGSPETNFDWEAWRHLAVQDEEDGRVKPLGTLARENIMAMTNRQGIIDPKSGQLLDATAGYLAMLFDWQGWEQATSHPETESSLSTEYFHAHKPDKWDQAPLLYVPTAELRKALGIPENQKYISPSELNVAKLTDPRSSQAVPLFEWADMVARSSESKPSDLEKKGVELANHLAEYFANRMGQRLNILPMKGDPHKTWASLAVLLQSDLDDKSDPDGLLRKAKDHFLKARGAYGKSDVQAFNEASAAFLSTLKKIGPDLGDYPSAEKIELEVSYNHWAPFRLAWILSLIAVACTVASKVANSRLMHLLAGLTFFAGFAAMIAGFTMRSMIAERAPVTNMYESVLSVAVGIALFGLIYELVNRKRYLLIASSALSALVILFAESFPTICDPGIHPLKAVLRSNFLLWIHVVPIMFSYAAFAVAWILANVLLGGYLSGHTRSEFMNAVNKLMLKIIRIGVFLLTLGTILGGYWADLSWGRFWGWDSKEVWALITLLCYLGVLHARYVGWLNEFGTTAWTVFSFVVVIMTWYGVNFELGTGMHSYGSGSGGVGYYVLAGLIVQFLYLLLAAVIFYANDEGIMEVETPEGEITD